MAPKDAIVTITETEKLSSSSSAGDEKAPTAAPVYPGYENANFNSSPSPLRHQNSDALTDKDENQLTELGKKLVRLRENVLIRYTFYIVPVAVILAIPIILCATIYRDARIMSTFEVSSGNSTSVDNIVSGNASQDVSEQKQYTTGGIRLLGLFVWIEVVWVLLWVAKLLAQSVPIIFQTTAGAIRTGIRKYSLILKAVEIPLSLFFWACFGLASRSLIWVFDKQFHSEHAGHIRWLNILYNLSRATVGVTALYLVQKLLIQMVSVNYHGKKQYDFVKELGTLGRAIETMYDVSRARFCDNHPLFKEDDIDIHDVRGYRKNGKGVRSSTDETTAVFLTRLGTTGDKITSVLGYMASDIAGKQVLMPTASGPIVEAALERPIGAEALARRIWNSFTHFGQIQLDEQAMKEMFGPGREAQAAYAHRKIDADENGDVTLAEMVDLVTRLAEDRRTVWEGACNIKDAIKVLDRVLGIFVLIFIGLIYAAFFSNYLATHYTQVWSTFTGCSFLFASTAGELFAACITVFIKHPYDVGDRLSINGTDMDVVKISLLYSVFREVHSRQLVQIPNSTINGLWIKNVTRSKELKEHVDVPIAVDTSYADLEILRSLLTEFTASHKRDFHPEVDLQVTSVADLKHMEIRIEFEHKGNSASEHIRASRRSKFICGMLSAMRAVPIAPPGGAGPVAGTKEQPNYAVTISDDEAKSARAAFDNKAQMKRFVTPTAAEVTVASPESVMSPVSVGGQPGSTGLEILPSLLRQTKPRVTEDNPFQRH
jgi:hypothetical protein